jgi:CBS-domain-containing membrane protein
MAPLLTWFARWRGAGGTPPPRPPLRQVLLAWVGGGLAMLVVALLAAASGAPLILGSFGATCVLVFGYPEVPFSQPRAVIGGHLLATAIGLAALHVGGDGPGMLALATGTAIAAMMWLRITHPPAGSNPVIVFLLHSQWNFLITPTAIGAVIIVVWALTFHNLTRKTPYPTYW